MEPAIALVETNSIAAGIAVGDAMLKKAPVNLLEARPVCPGKYIVLVGGMTDPVYEALQAGIEAGADAIVDTLFLPQVHLSIFPALMTATPPGKGEALGIIETVTVATCIVAADAAAKAADVSLLELRLANGLGGKSFVLIEGPVAEVEAAVEAGVQFPQQEGLLVRQVIISQLHEEMKDKIV
ncbi:MAG: BMC domain-containing protein [Anaerolineae bacterium]|nr:BMC domain-containing protein [Anaerolineae bacterium]